MSTTAEETKAMKRHRLSAKKIFWNWDIVWSCNFRCSYCFFANKWETSADKNRFPGIDKVIAAWDRIYDMYGSCHIHIAGGEPFIYPGFMDLLSALAPRHTMEMSSNMSFDVDEFMKRVPPGQIKLEPSFHIEFANFEEYIEKCKKLTKAGYQLGVTMVAGPKYLRRYVKMKDAFLENGIGVNLVPLRGAFYGKQYPDAYTDEEKRILKLAITGPQEEEKKDEESKKGWATPPPSPLDDKKEDAPPSGLVQPNGDPLKSETVPKPPAANGNGHENGDAKEPKEATQNASERYFEWHVEKDYEKLSVTRLCLMGFNYGKIHPNGDVLRCCTPDVEKEVYVGNIFDEDFKLLDEPKPCSITKCGCWKSMVVGQDKKWKQFWAEPEER